ncbi:hypothetical protein B447_09403 [Thauera sp. 27]|uniref:hypothetical protein n=1 Tax=Thauera sp. 27 TaxID=305700 RepID=UPI0002D0ACB4|nr:hypothetical protein [Thauera sp. 27]ENO81099.1 hypothetical protein B447_09403 [Thauera sp. 27]
MQSAAEYLLRTESAVRILFSGIDSYLSILRKVTGITFVTSEPYGPKQDVEFAVWQTENADRLATARAAEQEFMAESFALDTLCGSVLQVAEKALELYGSNDEVPSGLPPTVKTQHAKFCIGRVVRTVPLGLIIYAARNQHAHFNDDALREPSSSVFRLLATAHGYSKGEVIIDPAFDLSNQGLLSFASNVTSLIGWRSYEQYASDMHAMLQSEFT